MFRRPVPPFRLRCTPTTRTTSCGGGRPTILITSAEHYGAVLNLEFDYRRYLDTLAADGMNYTRVFSGAYVEPEGAFKIARNTLAPRPGQFLAPWPRSNQPGHPDGGRQVRPLTLGRHLLRTAEGLRGAGGDRNIVVELTLFCPMYEEVQWSLSPMNAANNINGIGNVGTERGLHPRQGCARSWRRRKRSPASSSRS